MIKYDPKSTWEWVFSLGEAGLSLGLLVPYGLHQYLGKEILNCLIGMVLYILKLSLEMYMDLGNLLGCWNMTINGQGKAQ